MPPGSNTKISRPRGYRNVGAIAKTGCRCTSTSRLWPALLRISCIKSVAPGADSLQICGHCRHRRGDVHRHRAAEAWHAAISELFQAISWLLIVNHLILRRGVGHALALKIEQFAYAKRFGAISPTTECEREEC